MYHTIRERQSTGFSFLEVSAVAFAITAIIAITVPGMKKVYSTYQLSTVVQAMQEQLVSARLRAMEQHKPVSVVFNASRNQFGVDWNANGSVDASELTQVPREVIFTPMTTVTFTEKGELPTGTGAISINVSTPYEARALIVTSDGSVARN